MTGQEKKFGRFRGSPWAALIVVTAFPVLGLILFPEFPDTLSSIYAMVIAAILGAIIVLVTARVQCEDCGETGGLRFTERHQCAAIRERMARGERAPAARNSRCFLVIVIAFLVLIGLGVLAVVLQRLGG